MRELLYEKQARRNSSARKMSCKPLKIVLEFKNLAGEAGH